MMVKIFCLGLYYHLLLSWGMIPADPSFIAFADAEKIMKGNIFNVSFTLNDARGSEFMPPDFKPFRIVGGPNRTISSSNINGAFSSKVVYTYQLQGLSLGKFTIGSASIVVQGQKLKTKPLSIEVIEGKPTLPGESPGGEKVIVRLVANYDTAYIGQQVLVDYKLYTQVTVNNFDIRFEPEYPNSFTQNIPTYNFQQRREIIDGTQYITKVMKRIALYPQQNGTIEIEPAAIALGMEIEDAKSRSFFFRTRVQMINLQTNPLIIQVLPLPHPAPISFNGSVGHYEMNCQVDKLNVKADQTITLTMQIVGDGDEKKIIPPSIDLGPEWEVYDPTSRDVQSDATTQKVKTQKFFEYLLVPKTAGVFPLIPTYSYFNPDSLAYVTLSDTFNINVLSNGFTSKGTESQDFSQDELELRPIRNLVNIRIGNDSFFQSNWHTLFTLVPVFLGLIALGYRRYQINAGKVDKAILRQKKARKVAIKRLEPVRQLLDYGDIRSSYDAISKAILGYVADKYKLPLADLNKLNIELKLKDYNVPESKRSGLMQLLEDCEQSIFAGGGTPEKAEQAYNQALDCISGLETP